MAVVSMFTMPSFSFNRLDKISYEQKKLLKTSSKKKIMVGLAEKIGCVFPRFLCVCLVRKGAEFAGFQMPKKHKDSEKVFVLAEKQKVCYSETKQKRKQTPCRVGHRSSIVEISSCRVNDYLVHCPTLSLQMQTEFDIFCHFIHR